MMKVVYSEMDTPAGISCRLEAAGHAGYAPAGQDIVCAGASTVMQGLVCLLAGEKSARSDAFDEPDGPRLAVQADAPCAEWVQGAFELAKACFALLAERYPENVRFADVSRRGEKSMMDLQLFAEGEAASPALSEAQTRQAVAAIREANSGYYDFYLALHSNAIGNGEPQSSTRGIIAFYYPGSSGGQRGAELIAENLREIYPLPDKVTTRPTTALGEVSRSRFPAVLVEIGYHDNYSDALWVEGHVEDIARQLVRALTEYFGLPFITPITPWRGTVRTQSGNLNLREYPSQQGRVAAQLPSGAVVTVYGQYGGWYSVGYQGQLGYAAASYIQ